MAEQSQADRKSQLIAELERSRADIALNLRGVRHDLDVGAHLKQAFLRQKTAWLTGAAVTGWVLSKLPSRKKKVQIKPSLFSPQLKNTERSGIALTLLGLAGTLLKPAVTAFVTRKISNFVSEKDRGNGASHSARRYSGR